MESEINISGSNNNFINNHDKHLNQAEATFSLIIYKFLFARKHLIGKSQVFNQIPKIFDTKYVLSIIFPL
jgi:hypothetical protein